MMNRKAIGWSTVAALIIGLAFLLVILFFLFKIGISSNNIVEDSECKSSIMSHYVIKQITREVLVSEIYCPTKYYTIPGKNDEETKKQLADAMKSCWGTWGRGELNLFEDEGYYCHICSVTSFKDKTNTVSGLKEYMTTMPIAEEGSPTYMEYLTGYSSEKADPEKLQAMEEKAYSGDIDTSKQYAAILVYAKGSKSVKKALDHMDALGLGTVGGGITIGAGVGTVVGVAAGVKTGLVIAPAVALLGGTTLTVISVASGVGAVVAIVFLATGVVTGLLTADDVDWVSMTLLADYNATNLEELECEISPARQDKVQKALG